MRIYWLESTTLSEKQRSGGRYQKLKYFSDKYEVVLSTIHSPDINSAIQREVCHKALVLPLSGRRRAMTLRRLLLLCKLIVTVEDCDILYTPSDWTLYLGALVQFLRRAKWIVDINEVPELQLEWMRSEKRHNVTKDLLYRLKLATMRRVIRRADLVVCLGASLDAGYPRRLTTEYGVPPTAIHPMPVGIISEVVDPDKYPHAHDEARFEIVYAGAIRRGRGLENLLIALAKLREKVPGITLTLLGPFFDEVERHAFDLLVTELKLSGLLEYRGHVTHDESLRCIATADVCVCPFPRLPALEYAYALKIPEYLAMGKAVVTTDLECNRGLIRNEENGILTTNNSPEELCNALYRLYRDRELREKLESNARSSVKHLDWEMLLAQLNVKIRRLALQP